MIITKVIYDYFKKFIHFELDLKAGVNIIAGKNGTGKSTTGIGVSWVYTGKDLELQDEPEIRNEENIECESSVTILGTIGEKKVKVRKFQVDTRTKKQKEQNAPVRIANRYEINDVPMTAKDFFKALESYGIDVENFLMLTNPDYFLSQKKADMRKILFSLVDGVTDLDVAKMIAECAPAQKELEEGSTIEELAARAKAQAKRCKEQKDAIPNQIIGLEKAKVETNPELPSLIKGIEDEIAADTEKLEEAKVKANADAINNRIRELRNRKTSMYNDANTERLAKYKDAYSKMGEADDAYRDAKYAYDKIVRSGDGINTSYKDATVLKARLEGELKNLKAEKFSGRTVCPTCGQAIPKEQIAEAKANWQKSHDERVKDIEDKLRAVKTQIESYKEEGKELARHKKDAEKAVADAKAKLDEAKANVDKYSQPINPDYSKVDAEINALNDDLAKCREYTQLAYTIHEAIAKKKGLLKTYTDAYAAEKNNDRIDERIDEMKASLRQYSQALADAESTLYQLQLISQKKNELLSEQVNSHFTRVKFRLFAVQKNGEIKDDCTPMVLCSDGEYRDMTYSANTAAIVSAKLDICSGLQKFYGQNLPIWLDGAECLDEQNRNALNMDNQLILLCVSEDDKLTVR